MEAVANFIEAYPVSCLVIFVFIVSVLWGVGQLAAYDDGGGVWGVAFGILFFLIVLFIIMLCEYGASLS